MTVLKKWLSGICAAWEMLIDLPLPRQVLNFVQDKKASPLATAVGFTSVGIILGSLLALLCGLLNISWINRYVAAGLFALIAVFFCEYKDSGRGLKLLISAIRRKSADYGWIDSILGASAEDNSIEKSGGLIALMVIVPVEIACFALLAYYRASLWCIPVFAGAFTVQMLFATLPRSQGNPPYLEIPSNAGKILWFLPVLIGIAALFIFPAGAIVAAAIVGGLGSLIYKNFLLTATPVTSDVITLSGKLTEIILLLAGIIFIL